MEHKAVDSLFPEWSIWNRFVAGAFDQALQLDALLSSHPVQTEVGVKMISYIPARPILFSRDLRWDIPMR